jgi:hypothetical protein
MAIRRFTRLTNAFSKKLDNHKAACALCTSDADIHILEFVVHERQIAAADGRPELAAAFLVGPVGPAHSLAMLYIVKRAPYIREGVAHDQDILPSLHSRSSFSCQRLLVGMVSYGIHARSGSKSLPRIKTLCGWTMFAMPPPPRNTPRQVQSQHFQCWKSQSHGVHKNGSDENDCGLGSSFWRLSLTSKGKVCDQSPQIFCLRLDVG